MANYRVNLMELQSGPDDSFGAFTSLDVVSVGVCVCVCVSGENLFSTVVVF